MKLTRTATRAGALLARMTLALFLMSPFVSPAHADLAPPRIEPMPRSSLPPQVKAWFSAAKGAMKNGSSAEARALCDARGFESNLVGGDGTTLASLFSQGHRKRWHLRAELARSKAAKKAYIAAADVVDDTNGGRLDSLYVLLVPGPANTLIALGAAESRGPIEALAKRWQNDEPLLPNED